MPEDRVRVFRAFSKSGDEIRDLIESGGIPKPGIGLREASRAIGCSEDKAASILGELQNLGVIYQNKEKRYLRRWMV